MSSDEVDDTIAIGCSGTWLVAICSSSDSSLFAMSGLRVYKSGHKTSSDRH